MPFLLLLLVISLIEIMLFIEVGGAIGAWPTIGLVVLAAMAGTFILRRQGLATLGKVQARLAAGESPGRPLADGAMILIAGLLLLIPGFLSDAIALVLLIPPVRGWLFTRMVRRLSIVTVQARRTQRVWPGGETVEGEFEEVDPEGESGPDGPAEAYRPIRDDRD